MNVRGMSFALVLAASFVAAAPAAAGLSPYLRVDWGGSQLRMAEPNRVIAETREIFENAGEPASYEEIGPGWGPGVSAGLWLFPALRVGGTWSTGKSVRHNGAYSPGSFLYAEDLDFRTSEVGGEAALRLPRLAGLTLGGHFASTRVRFLDDYYADDAHGYYEEHARGETTKTTYGFWVGIDQTNEYGVAGFIRLGWQARDVGAIPLHVRATDGSSWVEASATSVPLDYSGVYLKLGTGFDLKR